MKKISKIEVLSESKTNLIEDSRKAPKSSQHLKPAKLFNKFPFNLKLKHSEMLFKVEGDYPDVAKELKLRGWRNSEISSDRFFFFWSKSSKIFKTLNNDQIVNHLLGIQELSQKIKLCENLSPTSASFFPECYTVSDGEIHAFLLAYKKTLAESSLRTMLADCQSDEQVVAAIKESANSKLIQNFLNGGQISSRQELSELLNEISKKDPQFNLRGRKNLWIVKPGWMSRGRGIQLHKDIEAIQEYTREGIWVVQKYIENPLLINQRKFDIRQWVLITYNSSFNAYFYRRSYLRFSAELYDACDTENLYIHLTNNSIAKYSSHFTEEDSMWHSEQFQQWIIEQTGSDVWPEITKKIKEIVELTIKTVKNKLCGRRKCFELLGYDFMIDQELKPWIIEVNSSPAMDYSTPVTEALVKEMVPHMFSVLFEEKSEAASEHFVRLRV